MSKLAKNLKNRDMIRYRSLAFYEGMLGFNISQYAEQEVRRKGSFKWVDMCCGEFDAGRDLTYRLVQSGKQDIAEHIEAIGVDVDTFMNDPVVKVGFNARIYNSNAVDYVLPGSINLITCLRGLRYIEEYLKQGVLAVQNWYNQLPQDGILLFDCYDQQPTLYLEHGDLPILVREMPLETALEQKLGTAVDTYRTNHEHSTSFVVKITKQGTDSIDLL